MEILQIIGLGISATFLVMILKEQKPLFAFLLLVIFGVTILSFLVGKISMVIRMIERIAINADLNMVYLETILKIIGIAYIAEFGAQITKDAGQNAIASKIELAGKVLILVMAIPILTSLIKTVIGLIPE
ncbi:stage III sporulation protein AD [Tuberibacillus sp. Marseille-P3662]|uniref:stage III sporulation protein AD n=1 Tax=Tuberibacillus sp. Marseille-P3662 TaxID=1965358 RepID=UPI000A1CEC60|nr:stage III sporulation protein AD [Tuberibacillus sp. Marseille-P3662]